MPILSSSGQKRLLKEKIVWFSSIRRNEFPHLVPIWFVWVNKSLYIATEKKSVKVGNVQSNPNVSTCLEDGLRALICNGTATLLEVSEMTSVQQQGVIKGFEAKYNWNL